MAYIDITEPHRDNFIPLSTKIAGENTKILVGNPQILENCIFRVVFAMSCQFYTNNKIQDLRKQIAALKRELREADNEPDIVLRNLKIRWANFKLEEAIAKLRRMI